MAIKYIYAHRRGTTEQWYSSDIIPYDGELVIEKDGNLTRFKIGDGVNTYANLKYVNLPGCAVITKKIEISLLASNWEGTKSPYSQVITIDDVTANSKIDLQPSADQLVQLYSNETSLIVANDNKVITVYAIGTKPTTDYVIQATLSETIDN